MGQFPFSEDEIRFVLRYERLSALEAMQTFFFLEMDNQDFWDRLKRRNLEVSLRRGYTMVEINRAFDEMEQQFFDGVPKPERGFADIDNIFWFIAWHGTTVGVPVAIGRMMGELLAPALEAGLASFTSRQANAELTRLVFALEAYHRDKGNYPEALDDLLGDYIDEMPLDPFSGVPFRYITEPEGYLLYTHLLAEISSKPLRCKDIVAFPTAKCRHANEDSGHLTCKLYVL